MKKTNSKHNNLPSLSIVIPVYNESENIKKTIQSIYENVGVPYEILIVYDFDGDTTVPIIRRLKKRYRNLYLVKNNVARGPSGAIRTGLTQAKANRVLVTMADLCDDLTQIKQLLHLVPKYADIACPSRFCKGGEQQLKTSLKSLVPPFVGHTLKFITGLPTSDPTNSFKLYSKDLLDKIALTSTVSFSVTLEIVAKAHCLGFRIVEIPTVWKDRQHGKTNFKFGRSLVFYLPWFSLALLRNRIISLPNFIMRFLLESSR